MGRALPSASLRAGSARQKLVTEGNMPLGMFWAMGFAARVNYTYPRMAKAASKSKSAMDTLVDSFTRLRDEAQDRMSEEEFRQADEEFHQLANKVRASRAGKRETA